MTSSFNTAALALAIIASGKSAAGVSAEVGWLAMHKELKQIVVTSEKLLQKHRKSRL